MDDLINRQEAIDAVRAYLTDCQVEDADWHGNGIEHELNNLPAAQPEPLSDAYMRAVWVWLIDYQIKTAELKGRYTPYEVLSWVANDWRKEHEWSD